MKKINMKKTFIVEADIPQNCNPDKVADMLQRLIWNGQEEAENSRDAEGLSLADINFATSIDFTVIVPTQV